MMLLRVLVPFTSFLLCAARRSIRLGDTFHDAQQQTDTRTEALQVSGDTREAFLPQGLIARLRLRRPQAGALQPADKQVVQSRGSHGKLHGSSRNTSTLDLQEGGAASGLEQNYLLPTAGPAPPHLRVTAWGPRHQPLRMELDDFGFAEDDDYWQDDVLALPDEPCSIDNLVSCTQTELELLYVDVLWAYYDEKKSLVSDDQYQALVAELNWQGSGFPSLRRQEIAFVKAALAFAKGEPIVSDEQWQVMKNDVKASTGKRQEVTKFLLFAKSVRELPSIREKLEKEMCDAGIEMTVSPGGVSCTLSDVPTKLQNNVRDVLEMYTALSLVPTTISCAAWAVVALIAGGPSALYDTAIFGLPSAGVVSYGVTSQLIQYVELTQPLLLEGQCPCCESKIRYMASNWKDPKPSLTCQVCSTDLGIDVANREVGKARGLNIIGESPQKGEWLDDVLTKAALLTSDVVLGLPKEETSLGGPKRGSNKKDKLAPGTTAIQYSLDHLKDGIFAWSILLGFGIFGEQFIQRLRGKGIQLHSAAINAFCARYAIPKALNKQYIETAKRNGQDLGFLVLPPKLFGDGIFGKEALAWWKEQGF